MPAPKNPATAKKLGATLRKDQANRLPARPAGGVVSYAELAREVGLTASAVSYKIRRGMSVDAIRREGARRELARANGTLKGKAAQAGVPKSVYAARRAMVVKGSGVSAGAPLDPSAKPAKGQQGHRRVAELPEEELHNAQTRKEIALANLKELEEAQKRAELIPVAQVNNWMASAIMRARDIWSGLRDLSDRIRQEADAISAQLMVDAEMRRGFEELERFCEKMSRQVAQGEGVGALSAGKKEAA